MKAIKNFDFYKKLSRLDLAELSEEIAATVTGHPETWEEVYTVITSAVRNDPDFVRLLLPPRIIQYVERRKREALTQNSPQNSASTAK